MPQINFIDYVSLLLWFVSASLTILFAYAKRLLSDQKSQEKLSGFAVPLISTALPMALLGLSVTLTWPLTGSANIVIGEPSFFFGFLLCAAAWLIARGSDLRVLTVPATFGGLLLLVLAIAIMLNGIGAPPSTEGVIGRPPISTIFSALWAIGYSSTGIVAIIGPRFLQPVPSPSPWLRILSFLMIVCIFIFGVQAIISTISHVSMFSQWREP